MRPVFIGGCPRSGTTLLGSMLGSHSQCLATPESKFQLRIYRACMQQFGRVEIETALKKILKHWSFRIWDIDSTQIGDLTQVATYSDLITKIVAQYGRKVGKAGAEIWVDHTPANTRYGPTLWELYPNAKVIHLIRDGRATAASVMKLDWGPNSVSGAARLWIECVAHGLALKSGFGPERVREVRYERLVLDPEAALREICDFLGIDYEPQMVEGKGFRVPTYTARQHALVGRRPNAKRRSAWRTTLSPREIEIFESIAGNLLSSLGYELVYGLRARRMTWVEKARAGIQEACRSGIWNRVRRQRRIEVAIENTTPRSHGQMIDEVIT